MRPLPAATGVFDPRCRQERGRCRTHLRGTGRGWDREHAVGADILGGALWHAGGSVRRALDGELRWPGRQRCSGAGRHGRRQAMTILPGSAALPSSSRRRFAQLWTGRAMSFVVVAFLLLDGLMKLIELPVV